MVLRLLWVIAVGIALCTAVQADTIVLTQISTSFTSPIGIDYHSPTNSVVMSVNYSGGVPNNFTRVLLDGTHVPFSSISGFTDEVKIATVRPGNVGGFVAGTLFTGNGVDGEIVKIAPDGLSFTTWVSLPGAGNGLMRGSLYVDRTGVFGGDLIAATTSGQVWRITSAGTPSLVASIGTHLEGVITVPDSVASYGPLAGKIIAGAEGSGLLYAIDVNGTVTSHNVGVAIEDIDLISANENFFGVNFGTGRLLGAPASEFTPYVGDILLTSEFGISPTGLSVLSWDGSSLITSQFTLGAGSAPVGQWEHVTFAPAGIVEIPPIPPTGSEVPEPGTLILISTGLAGISRLRRRK